MIHRHPGSGILSRTSFCIPRLFACLLILCTGGIAAELADFAGSWKLDRVRSADPVAAIEALVAHVDSVDKASVRDRLREVSVSSTELVISLEKDLLRIAGDGSQGHLAPVDGSESDLTAAIGEPMKRRLSLDAGTLVESYLAEDGSRTDRYGLSSDGKTLFVDVSVIGGIMPVPVTFRLVYARQGVSVKPSARKARHQPGTTERYGLDGRHRPGQPSWRWPAVERAL
ncbi:MAG TPA: hypothetical protein PK208_01980 [Fibrobacteria bacterium]|nr:hypothetical protein [Fibrobacteria bacterium]